MRCCRKGILLDLEREKICTFLEESHIWYMPLKGVILKELYPKTVMRQMADNDILYDKSGQKQLMNYMTKCGYTVESVGKLHHDVYVRPPIYNFEMHTELFSKSHNKNFYIYYSKIENYLVKDNGKNYAYHLTDEDFYIYMTAHEYKHYNLGGTGLRSLLDRFLYIKKKEKSLNWDYIDRQIKILGISDFESESRKLSKEIFSGADISDMTESESEMLKYYIFSGTYGTMKNIVNKRMKTFSEKNGRCSNFGYLWRRIFPPAEFYKQYFPFFYKHKILIPVIWTFRLIRGMTLGRKKIKSELNKTGKHKSD